MGVIDRWNITKQDQCNATRRVMTVNQHQPQYILNLEKCDQTLLPGMGVSHFILDFAHNSSVFFVILSSSNFL